MQALGWKTRWHVDADHIRLETVDRFIPWSDFFTIDVADSIGKWPLPRRLTASSRDIRTSWHDRCARSRHALTASREDVGRVAAKYLLATREAGSHLSAHLPRQGADRMIAEVSMDETDLPQTPFELLVILAALADEAIPLQTIAPKFTGRFNKGVDYVGDLVQFEKEFNDDLAVLDYAIATFGLPKNSAQYPQRKR